MTPPDFTNTDEALAYLARSGGPLAGAVALESQTAIVPTSAYDRYLTACRAALAVSRTTDEVREIRNCADAIRTYAKRAKDRGLEADAFEIRRRAERRLGEMLVAQKETVGLNEGGRPTLKTSSEEEPVFRPATLAQAGIDKKLSMRAQRLAKLPEPEFDRIVADDRAHIIARGLEHAPLNNLTGNVEWFTDPALVERVRTVMGGIDLDPASCEAAQCTVKATQFFTKEQNGLTQPWYGRVFLNPPFRRDLIGKFVTKLISERANYEQAIALVNADTSTEWFQTICGAANAIAFPKRRLVFHNEITKQQNPVFGSAFAYFGDRRDAFVEVFGGSCLILRTEKFAEARDAQA